VKPPAQPVVKPAPVAMKPAPVTTPVTVREKERAFQPHRQILSRRITHKGGEAAFEVDKFLAIARSHARTTFRDATIHGFYAENVHMEMQGSSRHILATNLSYEYVSPEHLAWCRDNGTEFANCYLKVNVDAQALFILSDPSPCHLASRNALGKKAKFAQPRCTAAQIWQRIIKRGAPGGWKTVKGHGAKLNFCSTLCKKSKQGWRYTLPRGASFEGRSKLYFADDCKIERALPKAREGKPAAPIKPGPKEPRVSAPADAGGFKPIRQLISRSLRHDRPIDAFDVSGYLPTAIKQARSVIEDAQILRIEAAVTNAQGMATLKPRPLAKVKYEFVTPRHLGWCKDNPNSFANLVISLVLSGPLVTIDSVQSPCYMAPTMAPGKAPAKAQPQCTLAQIWKRAIKSGAPAEEHTASITFCSAWCRKTAQGWSFSMRRGGRLKRWLQLRFADDCPAGSPAAKPI
jgi:hypothetical protein